MNSIEAYAVVDPDHGPLPDSIRRTSDECVKQFVFGGSRRIEREWTREQGYALAREKWDREYAPERYRVAVVRIVVLDYVQP